MLRPALPSPRRARRSPSSGIATRQRHEFFPFPRSSACSHRGRGLPARRELKLWLEESNFTGYTEIRLLDEEVVAGTLTEAGGEPAIIETLTDERIVSNACTFAFFTGSAGFSSVAT